MKVKNKFDPFCLTSVGITWHNCNLQ